jgi:hypothetical protein
MEWTDERIHLKDTTEEQGVTPKNRWERIVVLQVIKKEFPHLDEAIISAAYEGSRKVIPVPGTINELLEYVRQRVS